MPNADAVLITGGTGSLGSAVAARFLADGAAVAVTYRSDAEWEALRAVHTDGAAQGRLIGLKCDVTDHDAVGAATRQAASTLGSIRVLAHVAGGYTGGTTVEALDPKTLRHMLDLNLTSAFWAAKHVIPHAKATGRGRLLFVSSRGAVDLPPGAAAYAAAKIGLHALVGTLAKELRDSGATVNAVLPSLIDTPQNRAGMPGADHSKWVRPERVADLLAFLASDAASETSGALIPIYGRA